MTAATSPLWQGRHRYPLLDVEHLCGSIDHARIKHGWTPRYSNTQALIRNYDCYCAHADSIGAAGVTHRVPWEQGALALAKLAFPARRRGASPVSMR
ncbi:MAG: hypothetical protein AB7P03_22535 [Kofleriaceae bacterium]